MRERPLGAGHSSLGGVDGDRLAQRARERLEGGLDHVVRVAAGFHTQVQRQLGGVGERTEELLRELVLKAAGGAGGQVGLEQRERASGDVDGAASARLVHGHGGRSVAGDAHPFAQRLVERLAEHDGGVLDGVVGTRLQVAADVDVEVDAPVAREQVEHVVEEADACVTRACACAFKGQRQAHIRLGGRALDGGCAAHIP